jgi:4-hydroxy-tetrahydrodipicolinate synthase
MKLISALPTFFKEDGGLDLKAQRKHLAWIGQHVDAVLVAGTTGEFPALSDEERIEVTAVALETLGRDKTIAHIGSTNTRQSRKLAARLRSEGVTRFSAITPYFLPASNQNIRDYYAELRDAIGENELHAYIFPERTGATLSAESFAQIAGEIKFDGVKLSGMAAAQFEDFAALLPNTLPIYSGADADVFRVGTAGGAGIVSGISAGFPSDIAALVKTFNDGTESTREAAQERVDVLSRVIQGSIVRIKKAVSSRGIGQPVMRMSADVIDIPGSTTIQQLIDDGADRAMENV